MGPAHGCYGTAHSIEYDIFNDLDGTLTRFQGHGIFEVEYLKNGAS